MALEDGAGSASGEMLSMAAARASVARPSKGTEVCISGIEESTLGEILHLHFQTLLQLHGFNKESTR